MEERLGLGYYHACAVHGRSRAAGGGLPDHVECVSVGNGGRGPPGDRCIRTGYHFEFEHRRAWKLGRYCIRQKVRTADRLKR